MISDSHFSGVSTEYRYKGSILCTDLKGTNLGSIVGIILALQDVGSGFNSRRWHKMPLHLNVKVDTNLWRMNEKLIRFDRSHHHWLHYKNNLNLEKIILSFGKILYLRLINSCPHKS